MDRGLHSFNFPLMPKEVYPALLSAYLDVEEEVRDRLVFEVCKQSNIINAVILLQCDINKLSAVKYNLPKTESSFLFNYKEHYLRVIYSK